MFISAAAYSGAPSDSTISLLLSMKGGQAVALADTASTNTFMNQQFAIRHNIQTTATKSRTVTVAGGGELTSQAIAHNCSFTVQGQQFKADFRILDLPGVDIILGVNWFKQYNPVTFSFVARTLTMGVAGTPRTFHDHLVPTDKLLISSDDCSKLLAQGATGYRLLSTTETEANTASEIPATLSSLLEQFQDIFTEPVGLPPKRDLDHSIPLLPGAIPPNIRPYRMSHSQKNIIETLVKQMLQNKEIRPNTSPYSSPIILVKKKDLSWRLCVDFRSLNAMTIKIRFPIPVIEDLLDELHGATIFSKLDLRSGYHQIRMKTADIPKTAFSTHFGHYEYLVMPFGLSNAPSTFQELMNTIFASYLRKFVLVFFDDILVYSSNIQEHKSHLEKVFTVLQMHQLKAKLSKCTFGQATVEYLGHIISGEGVSTNPSKIQDIVKWAEPQTLKKLRGFLGLTGYYRGFIQDYANICKPLYAV
jgi:hypothetical protein